jgi:lysophospholipase L1-like esterase
MMTEYGEDIKESDEAMLTDEHGNNIQEVLYGASGYSRYLLRGNGELCLWASSTRKEKAINARDVGFTVYGLMSENKKSNKVLLMFKSVLGAGVVVAIVMAFISWREGSSFASGLPGFLGGSTTRVSPVPGRTAVIGDSIVANTNGFVRFLGANVSGRTFDNMGVVGDGTGSIYSRIRSNVIGSGVSGRYDEVVIEGGVNDLGRRNPVEYVTNNLRGMVQEAKSAGLKVVLLTVTPYRAGNSVIQQINEIIKRDGRSWGADAVVDTWTPLADSNGSLRQEHTNDRVGLHPNHAGQLVMGQTILATAYR